MVSRSMHSEISDSNENDTPASAREALTQGHTETAAETDANTKTVTRVQTGGSNAPPIARDETRKARSGGAAGRRQGFRKTEANTRTAWNLPVVAAAGSVSKKYRLWDLRRVVLCGVVGLLLGTTVFTSVRRSANEATPSPTAAQLITADGARLSQVPGTQGSTALAPAVEEQLRALLSTAPALEPKLSPSSGQSTQIAAGQDRPQQQSASEVASPGAVEVSAIGEPQGANEAKPSPTSAQLITADGDNDPSQTTETVAAATSDQPTLKLADGARAQDGALPATGRRSLPLQVPSSQDSATPDDPTLQPTKMLRDRGDATPDSGPQAQLSQVLGTQASIALAPAVEEQLRALLSTAPALEPKLPPSSGQSTQIAAAQDRPQQRSASEAAGPRAVEVSAIGESQGPPQRERSTARQLNSDEITALISRGSDFLKIGDFSAARILLQRGAESGSADAALMLGKTFDPLFLHEIGAIGIKADVARCRQWYQKAVELGSETAAQRLANLVQTGQ